MTFTKHILPVVACLAIALLLVPQFVSAAAVDQRSVTVDAASIHADNYNELVNVGSDSSRTNIETWHQAPTGVYIGSSTEESLLRLNTIVPQWSRIGLSWDASFSSADIGSGVSNFVVRLPTYFSYENWTVWFTIWKVPDDNTYAWAMDNTVSPPAVQWLELDSQSDWEQVFYYAGSSLDDQVYDGNDIWTIDGRTYINAYAPLIPGEKYVFDLIARYNDPGETSYCLYLSPNDVAGDGRLNSYIVQTQMIDGKLSNLNTKNYTIDLGYSMDMRASLGNGVYMQEISLKTGDILRFTVWGDIAGKTGYVVLMIPIRSDLGYADMAVKIEADGGFSYTAPAKHYLNYIYCAVATSSSFGGGHNGRFTVTLTSADNQNIGLVMEDVSEWYLKPARLNPIQVAQGVTEIDRSYYFHIQSSIALSSNQVSEPIFIGSGELPAAPSVPSKVNKYGSIVADLALSGMMYLITGQIPGDSMTAWIVNHLPQWAKDGLSWVDSIVGAVRNAIDRVWDGLMQIGQWIKSIGEYIYNVVMWIVDAIAEYGSILLGLLIIGAALALFFVPLFVQLKLWSVIWRLAEGNLNAAAKEAQGLYETGRGVVSKFRRG